MTNITDVTVLTDEQKQRAAALDIAASAVRGRGFSASGIPPEAHGSLTFLADWIVDGPAPEETYDPEESYDEQGTQDDAVAGAVDADTYRCGNCGNDHDLADAVERVIAIAQADIRKVTIGLREVGLTDEADGLDELAASDRFRVATRDSFIAFTKRNEGKVQSGLNRLLLDVINLPIA